MIRFGACVFAMIWAVVAHAAGPVFSDGGPDAVAYGQASGYPIGPNLAAPLPQHVLAGTYSHWSEKYRHHIVAKYGG